MALKATVHEYCRKCGALDAVVVGTEIISGQHVCQYRSLSGPPRPTGARHQAKDVFFDRTRTGGKMTLGKEMEAVLAAALPFAAHDWCDAELEDDNCKLTKHSGRITVGHWRALRAAVAKAIEERRSVALANESATQFSPAQSQTQQEGR